MATTDGKKKKTEGDIFSNELKYVEFVYDIALGDSGTAADLIKIGKFEHDVVIEWATACVKTAFVGPGASFQVGDTDDDDSFLAATAVGSLTANAILSAAAGQKKFLASGKEIICKPTAANFTAGKLILKVAYSML